MAIDPGPDSELTRLWLRRILAPGLDRRAWWRLHRAFGIDANPEELAAKSAGQLQAEAGLSPAQIDSLRAGADEEIVEREWADMRRIGARLLWRAHPEYPVALARMNVPPAALFVVGTLHAVDELAVGIVGSRKATGYGKEMSHRLARDLAASGLTVVSGFAVGIDAHAHQGALSANGRTIGVLGCGLAIGYPASNGALRRRLLESGSGALISEYPMRAEAHAGHFPQRNTIIAGLSLGVIVVEAAQKSGALITATAAGEENRLVFVVPGDVVRESSRGSNALLREGAIAVQSVHDVLEDLAPQLQHILARLQGQGVEASIAPPPLPPPYDPQEHLDPRGDDAPEDSESAAGNSAEESPVKPPPAAPKQMENVQAPSAVPLAPAPPPAAAPANQLSNLVLRRIQQEAVDLDTLMSEFVPMTMNMGRLSSILLQLELSGAIKQLPGKTFVSAR